MLTVYASRRSILSIYIHILHIYVDIVDIQGSILTIFSGHQEVYPARPCDGPHLHNGRPQLQVSLVNEKYFVDC